MKELLLKKLNENVSINVEKVGMNKYGVEGLTFLKLRDALLTVGKVIEEDEANKIYVASIKAGFADMNTAYIAAGLDGKHLLTATYAKEGIINQHTGEKAVKKLTDVLENKPKKATGKRIVISLLVLLAIATAAFFKVYVRPATVATGKYNDAAKAFNETAKKYNDKASKSAVYNIEGFQSHIDSLQLESMNPVSVAISIIGGNRADRIDKDADTIRKMIKNMEEKMVIIDRITNPSLADVMSKLEHVDSVKNCQAVTKENDPNQSLGKEGGYKDCVYFTVDQIDDKEVNGNDAVAKGTDGGGAIEIYKTIKDAEARCDYLSGFDNTILYSGSYAIIGTTVVRTSYILNNEEQYNLTSEITKALTQ